MNSISLLKALQAPTGLFIAAPANSTGYTKAWLRDNVYMTLGLESIDAWQVVPVYHKLLDIFHKHEYKISIAIKNKPKESYEYIHARYHPETLEEFHDPWGNKQHDAVGAFLFKIGDLISKGYPVLRNEKDKEIVQKLVYYLESIEYWQDPDNGMWEEYEEVHASSVGACLAGLISVKNYVNVPEYLIEKGRQALDSILPSESITKKVDLALLSLIYPYKIVSSEQAEKILENIEKNLVRKRGVIRYIGDQYYNKQGEAEWTMGLLWMSICYKELGYKSKYLEYLSKSLETRNSKGEFPELYYSNSEEHNDNSPLGWAQSLHLVATLN